MQVRWPVDIASFMNDADSPRSLLHDMIAQVRKVWCVRTENAQDGICITQDLVRDLIPDVWVVYIMCIGKFMYKDAFCLLVWNQAV